MKMGRLRTRALLQMVGSLAFTALFLSSVGIQFLKSRLEYEFSLRHLALTRMFSIVSSHSLHHQQMPFIQDFLDSLLADPDLEEVYLLSPQGKPLASKTRVLRSDYVPSIDKNLFGQAMLRFTPQIRSSEENGQRYQIYYQRIWSETENNIDTLGIAYLKFNYYRLTSQLKHLTRVFLGATAAVIVFASLLSYLFSRKLLKPIERLRNASIAVGKGDFSVSLPVETADEIGELAQSFNDMSHRLKETTVSKDFMSNILSNMIDPLIVMDMDTTIRMVNQATLDLLEYSREELEGQSAHILFLPKDKPPQGADKETLVLESPVRNLELEFIKKSAVKVPVLFSSSVLKDSLGQPTGIIAVAKDVTERKRLENIVRRSDKMSAVGQLAAGVAHEINNPLGVILGFAQAALRRLTPGEMLEMPLKSIEKEAVRCRDLVQDLLTFSRISKMDREPMDLNHTIEGALSLVTAQARVERIQVRRELAPDLPRFLGNVNQIQQVIVNLSNNALDAMTDEGVLTVRTENIQDGPLSWISLKVSDTGPGIPPEVLLRIFEPFFTTKPVGKGTGLGLSLVHEIVKKHSGTIDVKSRPGFTEFCVKFPVHQTQGQNYVEAHAATSS